MFHGKKADAPLAVGRGDRMQTPVTAGICAAERGGKSAEKSALPFHQMEQDRPHQRSRLRIG